MVPKNAALAQDGVPARKNAVLAQGGALKNAVPALVAGVVVAQRSVALVQAAGAALVQAAAQDVIFLPVLHCAEPVAASGSHPIHTCRGWFGVRFDGGPGQGWQTMGCSAEYRCGMRGVLWYW